MAIMKSRKRSMGGPQKRNAKSNDNHGGGLASSLGTPSSGPGDVAPAGGSWSRSLI